MSTKPSKEYACNHPQESAVYAKDDLDKYPGPTVVKLTPRYPCCNAVQNGNAEPLYLSRLACGHYATLHPSAGRVLTLREPELPE